MSSFGCKDMTFCICRDEGHSFAFNVGDLQSKYALEIFKLWGFQALMWENFKQTKNGSAEETYSCSAEIYVLYKWVQVGLYLDQ